MSVDDVVEAVSAWAAAAVPGTEFAVCAPQASAGREGVSLSVLGYRGVNDSRHTLARRDPVVDILEAELLLTVALSDALAQARLMADIHFAALAGAPFTVASPEETRAALRDLGLPPGVGILLRARIARQREARPVRPVREAVFHLADRRLSAADPAIPVEPIEPA